MARGWRNWARNQSCQPRLVEHPASAEDIAAAVKRAAAAGQAVKAVGSGHSFTDIACTAGHQLVLDRYTDVVSVDGRMVTVQAGITIGALNERLSQLGLGLANLGDIGYQTISGAVSTGTHGTGIRLGGLATQIRALELVTADGSLLACSPDVEPEVFGAARVSLGALGVVSTLTFACAPAFNLHAVEEPIRVDQVLAELDDHVEGNDHFEFYWVPHTGWALTKRNNRTDEPIGGRSRVKAWRDQVLVENIAFGAVNRVGRLRPAWIPRLARLLPNSGRVEYVERSDKVFTTPRFVHFYEMEYAVPRAAAADALTALRAYVERSGLHISFPVEVRFAAPDDIPLSTANGRDSCYLAVHVYWGTPYQQYFKAVESIMDDLGGRPHWGKLHFQSAATLAPRYPQWDRFQSVRRRLDPEGRFTNPYLERVLGPV